MSAVAAGAYSAARRRRAAGALAGVLLIYLALAIGSARQMSVTVDELGHLPSGLYFLATGDARYSALNPPLINALSALPVLLMQLESPLEPPPAEDAVESFWDNGYHFQEAHRADYLRAFAAARLVPIALVACLGIAVFFAARSFAPDAPELAGLMAATALCLSPNVIAHARMVGTDTGTALAVTAALLALRRMLVKPGVATALVCGIALGVAQLTKFYALLLYPVFLAVALAWYRLSPRPRPAPGRVVGCLALAGVASLLVLDSGYLWRDVGVSLGEIELASPLLASLADAGGGVPLPVPAAFLRALDGQLAEVGSTLPSYLLGESFEGGRWYFFLGVLALKTPPGLALFFGLAVLLGFRSRRLPARETLLLLAYPAALFIVLSASPGRQLGGRALLSAVPLVWLWCAATVARSGPRGWPTGVAAAALAGILVTAVWSYPHYLAYFNPAAGGTDGGYRYASGSNVDIGQDLPALARFLEETAPGQPVQLLYFGSVDPEIYGIDYVIPDGVLEPGLFAVSVSLYRTAYPMYDGGALRIVGPVEPVGIGDPIAVLGGSIHVYRVGD